MIRTEDECDRAVIELVRVNGGLRLLCSWAERGRFVGGKLKARHVSAERVGSSKRRSAITRDAMFTLAKEGT